MMKYKGINVEKIKEIQRVKLPNADAFAKLSAIDIENICSDTDSFNAVCNQIKKELEARKNDTEMAIICEMALNYLQSMKDKEVADKEAYNKGLGDAWEFVTKTNTSVHPREAFKLLDFFGVANYRDIYVEYTPQEALAKLEAYEKGKEIKVGDVVEGKEVNVMGVVVKTRIDGMVSILFRDGSVGNHKLTNLEKTGKHIDIQKILEQIAGE